MILCFIEGRQGLICHLPPGGGPWIVPGRKERHTTAFAAGQVLDVEITGASQAGNLRFCRVVRNITAAQETALEKLREAAQAVQNYEELKGQTWDTLSVPSPGFSFCRSYRYDICINADGKPAVSSFEIEGRWLECEKHCSTVANYVARPKIALADPLPLSGEEAQQALCYLVVGIATPNYTSVKTPAWAGGFLERISKYLGILEELERRISGKSRIGKDNFLDWDVVRWLEEEVKRLDVFDLRALIERVQIPLEKAQAELVPLLPSMPTQIRLSDGVECYIEWEGKKGVIRVSNAIYGKIYIDPSDSRATAIKTGGNSLWAKSYRPCQHPVEAFESPFSGMGCYEVTRQLI